MWGHLASGQRPFQVENPTLEFSKIWLWMKEQPYTSVLNHGLRLFPPPRFFSRARRSRGQAALLCFFLFSCNLDPGSDEGVARYQLATFSADVTIPLGHRCMGVLPSKSRQIVDPLEAHGFVLLGAGDPIVVAAVDWCEIRNQAYDEWRTVLSQVAGTPPERVLVTSLHQHDAPVIDGGAEKLLEEVGLGGELYDRDFHERSLRRVGDALAASLDRAVPVSHLGMGQARVEKVASNRRVVQPDGRVSFSRGSRSGGDPFLRQAPEGLIDPFLKTLSFWNGETPVLALHAYATHPMSHYGQGQVSWDFVGMARERRRRDEDSVHQIYVSGCSGDVTAGKYNDASPDNRPVLADRLYRSMVEAWSKTRRLPLGQIAFRSAKLELEFHPDPDLTAKALESILRDSERTVEDRILAAMGLASRQRVAGGQGIDLPVIDFGPAQVVLFPGESFVGYQLMAQKMRSDSFVLSIGYGECWPGYIPTEDAFRDGFEDKWLWVAPGSETRIRTVLQRVLLPGGAP